jgi:hypothetical protein
VASNHRVPLRLATIPDSGDCDDGKRLIAPRAGARRSLQRASEERWLSFQSGLDPG